MEKVETTILDEKQIADIKALMKKVHQFDKSFRDPYLSNQYNFFPEMPTFILGYEKEILIGFVMLYADENPLESGIVDIYLNVSPEFRQKGYGTKLKNWAIDILYRYGYKNFEYVSEMNFLKQYPDFLPKVNLTIDPESEYQMYYEKTNTDESNDATYNAPQNLQIKELEKGDISEIASMSAAAFESDLDEVARMLETGLTDAATKNFVLIQDDQKIGFGKVDLTEKYYYIYNLLIDEDFRNQGFGTTFVKMIVRKLLDSEVRKFKIGVDQDNVPAVKAYKKAGFVVETEVVYLIEK